MNNKKIFFIALVVFSFAFAQEEEQPVEPNEFNQSEHMNPEEIQQESQNEEMQDNNVPKAEPVEVDAPEDNSKKKIVLTESKENRTEVITTYSGDENILKSPKKAFFLSLIIPGLGEYYAKASVPRIAVPVGIEVATYVTAAIFNAKYKERTKIFKKFADQYYSHEKFDKWFKFCLNADSTEIVIRTTAHDEAYYKNDQKNKTNDYYEMIGKYDIFAQGWDDVDPFLDSTYYYSYIIPKSPIVDSMYWTAFALKSDDPFVIGSNGRAVAPNFAYERNDAEKRPYYFGKSLHQLQYMKLRDDANNMADVSRAVLYTLIVTRIVSAIDAALAATSYNTMITGGTLTNYQKVRLEPLALGHSTMPVNGVGVTYTFK